MCTSRPTVAHTSRIARLWAGLGITTIAVFPALHPTILTAPILPPILPVNGWGIIALVEPLAGVKHVYWTRYSSGIKKGDKRVTIAERVQQYIIESRRQSRTVTLVGPFSVLLHATDSTIESNVAIPRTPPSEAQVRHWHEPLRAAFTSQGRIPAIQWTAEFAPHLASTLQARGFSEHQRETLLICTPQTRLCTPVPAVGLTFTTITDASPLEEVRENLDINELGFDPAAAQPATDEQAAQFRATLRAARAFTARLHGRPAGAGMYIAPMAGVTELVGIATLEQYRGRGIAAALTAHMASAAFAQGSDLAFLWTANPAARRAYEHAGFRPAGDVLTYAASVVGPVRRDAEDGAIGSE